MEPAKIRVYFCVHTWQMAGPTEGVKYSGSALVLGSPTAAARALPTTQSAVHLKQMMIGRRGQFT